MNATHGATRSIPSLLSRLLQCFRPDPLSLEVTLSDDEVRQDLDWGR